MVVTDFYNILGVTKESNASDIKKAYRALSLKYHPDRNASEDAKNKILKINEAYETLGDVELRNKYDSPPINNIHQQMHQHMHQHGGINLFENMVNGSNIRFHHTNVNGIHSKTFHFGNRIEPINIPIEITFEQSYTGYVHKFNINRTVTTDGVSTPEDEELFLNIPRGINSGQTITLADKGNISNGAKGQLNVHVKVKNESIFKRDGLNLIYNTKITLIEALCGFSHEFTHVSGAKLCLSNDATKMVIKPGYNQIIPNRGMIQDNKTGNLIITFDIIFPDKNTQEQISQIKSALTRDSIE